ncbi:MAG: NAD(P)H-binding protein [Thermomicrobiales bacterium]|nr:NAD(P)H-binding protein [Thermomicrobiales bacterium]
MTDRSPLFITGGAGFVGSAIQTALSDRPVRILVRSDDMGRRNQHATAVTGDVTNAESLRGLMDGCTTVVHLVAIIEEEGDATFDTVIRKGTEHVVAEAQRAGVEHIVHMSALGVRNDPAYPYFHAKHQAEVAVQTSGIPWTIMRPSIIFGPGDGFINQLADLVRSAPVVPIAGSGRNRFQPVSVADVADAFVWAIDHPESHEQIYELGGPDVLTYDEIMAIIQQQLGTSKRAVHIPASLVGGVVSLSSPLPSRLRPPVTKDQLKMLDIDNVTADSATERLTGRPPRQLRTGIDYLTS